MRENVALQILITKISLPSLVNLSVHKNRLKVQIQTAGAFARIYPRLTKADGFKGPRN